MRLRIAALIATLALGILATPLILTAPLQSEAQQPTKVPRIGYLVSSSFVDQGFAIAVVRFGLVELGYREGQNIAVEERPAGGRDDRLPDLAAELVRLKVVVINLKTAKALGLTIPQSILFRAEQLIQ